MRTKCPWCKVSFSSKGMVKDHRDWGCPTRIVQMYRKGWTVKRMMDYIVMPEIYIQEIIDKAMAKDAK